jgi:Mrp family chromosome partitioning ATPase
LDAIAALPPSEELALKESLRQLFAALRDLQQGHGARLLAITSTAAGEGRSTAVAALALTLADLGRRVLVVDADLRLSRQHQLLGLTANDASSPAGLADLLEHDLDQGAAELQQRLEALIQTVGTHLDLLPAGRPLADPARRLHATPWQACLQQLRDQQRYDLIVLDTPACELLSDAALLGPGLDGLLFLVGLGEVERHRAQQTCRRLQRSGATVLAVLANQRLEPNHLNDDGQHHGVVHHLEQLVGKA